MANRFVGRAGRIDWLSRWVCAAGLLWTGHAAFAEPAEVVVQNAAVVTMDGSRPFAQAVAVRGGRVVYVGNDVGVRAFVGPHTRTFSGSKEQALTVLPGLIDAHAHLFGLGTSLVGLDLRGLSSVDSIIKWVSTAANKSDDKEQPVLGRGFDQNRFSPPEFPDLAARKSLDEASQGHPVWLRRIDGHAGWANEVLLRRAGIDRHTQVPGGRILRDASGEPTGVLIDNAMELVEKVLPKPSDKDLEAAILRGADFVVARGLTAVHEMGVSPAVLAAYVRLAEQGRLPLRVYAYAEDPIPSSLAAWPHSLAYQAELERVAVRFGPPFQKGLFAFRGFKLFLDGALGSRGAALTDPYSDEPTQNGLLLCSPDHIEAMARFALLHGYQLTTHAIGDRANDLVLEAYEHAGLSAGRNARFRIEHAQVLSERALGPGRFSALGVIASVQPQHQPSDAPWAGLRLGKERLKRAYAYRSLLDSSAKVVFGSDFPVEEADPRLTLHAAIWRAANPTPHDEPNAGAFSVGEALRMMTVDAAYAAFADDRLGKIAVGHGADLTVLAGTLSLAETEPPPKDLAKRRVILTMVDGKVSYDAETGEKTAGRKPVGQKPSRK